MRISSKASFIIALILLATSAFALEGTTRFLKLHFRKEAVELPQPLERIPGKLGPWVQISTDAPLPEDIEHTLGTSQYIFRDYVDSRIVKSDVIDSFKDKSPNERKELFLSLQREMPEAAISLAVTYYTGLVDTVSHVPDRCYIADGYDVAKADELKWSAGGKNLSVRYLSFQDTSGFGRVNKNVAYLFQANGQYVCDPIDVRRILANLFARYGYYAKVELMTVTPDQAVATRMMDDFLGSSIPAVEAVLPDWNQYKGKN